MDLVVDDLVTEYPIRSFYVKEIDFWTGVHNRYFLLKINFNKQSELNKFCRFFETWDKRYNRSDKFLYYKISIDEWIEFSDITFHKLDIELHGNLYRDAIEIDNINDFFNVIKFDYKTKKYNK